LVSGIELTAFGDPAGGLRGSEEIVGRRRRLAAWRRRLFACSSIANI
jgi:hypothetical protein